MYANGSGVPQDDAEAVRWYRLAADQGVALAQYNLGLMYQFGSGVPQDDVQAHMWFNLAALRLTSALREIAVPDDLLQVARRIPRPSRRRRRLWQWTVAASLMLTIGTSYIAADCQC